MVFKSRWLKADYQVQTDSLIPFMENEETALTIINEFHEELKLIFDIQ